MNVRAMHLSDIPRCADLATAAYAAECAAHGGLPFLPAAVFAVSLTDLLSHGGAFVAEENGSVCGYLAFTPSFDGAFGRCKGVFSPMHGSAFFGSAPSRTCTLLLSHALEHHLSRGISSVAVCSYAHNEPVLRTLAFGGFGFRCSDLMRKTAPADTACDGYTFRPMQHRDLPRVTQLYNALEAHMASSPVFMKKTIWTEERLLPLLPRIYVACRQDEPVACLLLESGGETLVDEQPHTMHVSSTFCHPDHRGSGVMSALVDFVSDLLYHSGIEYLGVDCETLNPPAFRFWQKHFTPFTLSAVRRLDERLIP